jgi:hypothetical protein
MTAAMMGLAGTFYSPSAMFVAAAVLCIPALVAVSFIRADEIDYLRARNATTRERTASVSRGSILQKTTP